MVTSSGRIPIVASGAGKLPSHMEFCSPFDAALAAAGPPAVFLPDREGLLRFDAEWTRDAWGRNPGPHAPGARWTLLRDHDTGFVMLALVTSPTLLPEPDGHHRMDVRSFDSAEDATAARATYGEPPICTEAW